MEPDPKAECPSCHKEVESIATACPHCKHPLGEAPAVKRPNIALLAACSVLVIGLAFAGGYLASRGHQKPPVASRQTAPPANHFPPPPEPSNAGPANNDATPTSVAGIQIGMAPDDVKQALGEPDQTSDPDQNAPNNYSWSYSDSGVEVMFVDGKVSAINKHDVPPPDDHLIDNSGRITIGMSQDQVRNILGAPEHTEEQDTQDGVHEEHWEYWGSSKAETPKVDVIFHGGVVDTVQKNES